MSGPRPPVRPRGPPPRGPPPGGPPGSSGPPAPNGRPPAPNGKTVGLGNIGDFKKPAGPPPRPPSNGPSTVKLKPPPMAPPPRELNMKRPDIQNIKSIDPTKHSMGPGGNGKPLPPGAPPRGPPGRGAPPRGFVPSFQPTDFQADNKIALSSTGGNGQMAPKFSQKLSKKEGAIAMFESDPNAKKLPPSESKGALKGKPQEKPPPPTTVVSGIPPGKPQPPKQLPPSSKMPPRPMKPPPGSGRAPPPLTPDEEAELLKRSLPPKSTPPHIKGKKEVYVPPPVILKRREKEDPEFESSSDEEEGDDLGKGKTVPDNKPLTAKERQAQELAAAAARASSLPNKTEQTTEKPTDKPTTPVPQPQLEPTKGPVVKEVDTLKKPSTPVVDSAPVSRPPTAQDEKSIVTIESRPSTVASQLEEDLKRPSTRGDTPLVEEEEDDNHSELGDSIASHLITMPPPGVDMTFNSDYANALKPGVGDFVIPMQINQEGVESRLIKEVNGGRLNIIAIEGYNLRRRTDKSKNPRIDPYIKFRLGAADKWPWKETEVKRKQDTNPNFEDDLISFDVVNPVQYIFQEDLSLTIEVWNKGTFKDEIIGAVTMSVVRFFKNPYKKFEEKIPILAPGERTSNTKVLFEFMFQEARAGMFVFTMYEGNDLRNVDPMGQQHPFVQLALETYKKQSKTIHKGGRDPYFAEEEVIMWVDTESWVKDLRVSVCDQEIGETNPIGYTDVCLLSFMDQRPSAAKEEAYELFYQKDKNSGEELAQGTLNMKVAYMPAGKLEMTIVRGKSLLPVGFKPGSEESVRIDPYLAFTLNSQAAKMSKRCPVDKDGGSDPVWDSVVNFDVVDQYLMDVACYSQNIQGQDELIGTAQLSLLAVFKGGVQNVWITLKQDKPQGGVRECGDVNINLKFTGPPAIAYPQYRPNMESFDDALRTGQSEADKKVDEMAAKSKDVDTEKNALTDDILADVDAVPTAEFSEDEIKNAFKFIDLDHNNFVGAAEIRHILVCMGELITDEEIDMMISMVDLDGDGQVSFVEFRNLVLHPSPADMDKEQDLNFIKEKELNEAAEKAAGKQDEVDSATYARQKEMQNRDMKKKMILNFLGDHEYDFNSLRLAYQRYEDLPKEFRMRGMVDFTQFCDLLKIDHINENNRLFSLFDPERNGVISFKEFLLSNFNFVDVTKETRLLFTFKMFDEAKSGYISLNEVREVLIGNHMMSEQMVERKAQTIMRQAVANTSNTITQNEFLVVSKKFPNIILPSIQGANVQAEK